MTVAIPYAEPPCGRMSACAGPQFVDVVGAGKLRGDAAQSQSESISPNSVTIRGHVQSNISHRVGGARLNIVAPLQHGGKIAVAIGFALVDTSVDR
jgi:hypothetical protein